MSTAPQGDVQGRAGLFGVLWDTVPAGPTGRPCTQVRPLHVRHPRLRFPCQLPPPGPDLTTHWPASCPFRSGPPHAVGRPWPDLGLGRGCGWLGCRPVGTPSGGQLWAGCSQCPALKVQIPGTRRFSAAHRREIRPEGHSWWPSPHPAPRPLPGSCPAVVAPSPTWVPTPLCPPQDLGY